MVRCAACGQEHAVSATDPKPWRTRYVDEPDKAFRFTKERRSALLLLLQAMVPHDRACKTVQCSEETPRAWRDAGRLAMEARDRGELLDEHAREQVEFALLYEDALTFAEANLVGRVQSGAKQDWKAAAWLLSVKRPEEYSERWKVKSLQLDAEAPIRRAEQEGKETSTAIQREKLEQIREARQNGGQVLVIGADELVAWLISTDDLPADLREQLVTVLNDKGFRFVEARDLSAAPQ